MGADKNGFLRSREKLQTCAGVADRQVANAEGTRNAPDSGVYERKLRLEK